MMTRLLGKDLKVGLKVREAGLGEILLIPSRGPRDRPVIGSASRAKEIHVVPIFILPEDMDGGLSILNSVGEGIRNHLWDHQRRTILLLNHDVGDIVTSGSIASATGTHGTGTFDLTREEKSGVHDEKVTTGIVLTNTWVKSTTGGHLLPDSIPVSIRDKANIISVDQHFHLIKGCSLGKITRDLLRETSESCIDDTKDWKADRRAHQLTILLRLWIVTANLNVMIDEGTFEKGGKMSGQTTLF
jgi:hypothetical protein